MLNDDAVGIDQFVSGNYFDKYRTTNPLYRHLTHRFLCALTRLVDSAAPTSMLEVGCGPGDLAARLLQMVHGGEMMHYVGIDRSASQIMQAKLAAPSLAFDVALAESLPFQDASYDIVVACEVLEHLEHPRLAVGEMARVTRRWCIVSVPWEPLWRSMNFCRGKYLRDFGNTPGHLNHFSRRAIRELVQTDFRIVDERHPLPWSMLLLEKLRLRR